MIFIKNKTSKSFVLSEKTRNFAPICRNLSNHVNEKNSNK